PLQRRPGFGESGPAAAELERDRDVFERGHRRQQMKRLEDDADLRAAQAGEPVLVERGEVASGELDPPRARPLQPRHNHHQRRFARARRPDERDRLALRDGQRHPAQDLHRPGRAGQAQSDVVEDQEGHELCGIWLRRIDFQRRLTWGPALPSVRWMNRLGVPILALLLLACGPAGARTLQIVDIGDSLTAGFGLPAEEAFPARLEARLKAQGLNVHIANAGNSGDTTAAGPALLDWALGGKPDLVILALGANDALRGTPPAEVKANLDKMIEKIQASGAKLLLLGMRAPPNWGKDYQEAFDRIYRDLAQRHHVT